MEWHNYHGQVVVPVFYDVDPSVVRHQKGQFGDILAATAKKLYFDFAEERMKYMLSSWRTALTQAANLSALGCQ